MIKRLFVIVLIFGSLGGGWLVFSRIQQAKTDRAAASEPVMLPPATVAVTTVAVQDFPVVVEFDGEIKPRAEVDVFAKVPGRLEALSVAVGADVGAGDQVAVVEHREIEQQLAQAKAAAAAAKAAHKQALVGLETSRVQYKRYKALKDSGAVAEAEFDRADAAFRQASAAVATAGAQAAVSRESIGLAELTLANSVVTAPITGTVVKRPVEFGSHVSPGVPLVTIQDLTMVKLIGTVPPEAFLRLKKGDVVSVRVNALPGTTFVGTVSTLVPTLDPVSRRATVEVEIPNPDKRLMPNLFAHASIEVGMHRHPSLPRQALVSIAGEQVVFKLAGDKARLVRPKLGPDAGDRVAVLDGLAAGDVVLVEGQSGLTDGAPVQVVTTTAAR